MMAWLLTSRGLNKALVRCLLALELMLLLLEVADIEVLSSGRMHLTWLKRMVWLMHATWHNTMLLQAKAIVVTKRARHMSNIAEHINVRVLLSTRC